MNKLRQTIRKLILENSSKDNPNYQMLDALVKHSSFRLIDSGFEVFPNGDRATFWYEEEKDCPYVVKVICHYTDVIYIDTLEAYHEGRDTYSDACEGKGYASQLLSELMSYADAFKVQLSLEASAFAQTDDKRRPDTAALTAWYKRLGFEDSPQDNGLLVYNFRA